MKSVGSVVLVDTSILLNVLDIPGFNQHVTEVRGELPRLIDAGDSLLLPIAAIVETGNHIAHLPDGNQRRKFATIFVEEVGKALSGEAPWRPTRVPDAVKLAEWLHDFPDQAMRRIGVGDLTIIREWEAACEFHPTLRVRIWSLDRHLKGYDRPRRSPLTPRP